MATEQAKEEKPLPAAPTGKIQKGIVKSVRRRRSSTEVQVLSGDTVIILMGDPIDRRPLTNLMRVHRVRG